jgi:hypothetical protein
MNSRQRRCRPTSQARSRILAAAIREVTERGLDRARMSSIAAAGRANPGLLHGCLRAASFVDRARGERVAGSVLAAMPMPAGAVPRRRIA